MKTYINKIGAFIILLTMLNACQLTPKHLGEDFQEQNIQSIDAMIEDLKLNKKIENAKIEGKIYKTCLSEGCWFMIQDKDQNEIILRIKDKKFRMPNTSADKSAVVLLDASVVDTTYQADEWYAIEVKGIKFK